jgi:hypothetical protein
MAMKIGRSLNVFPPMQCDDGCGDCCGVVPVTKTQLERVRRYVKEHGIVPRAQGETCPLYLGGRCSVYPVRPPVCVAYGHSARLPCSRGYNTNVPEAVVQRFLGLPEPLTHFLYEVLDEVPPEANALMRFLGPTVGIHVEEEA